MGSGTMSEDDERRVVTQLCAEFPIFAESTIRRWVAAESSRYASARIKSFVPVLVTRSVAATLRELARAEGTSSDQLTLVEARALAR